MFIGIIKSRLFIFLITLCIMSAILIQRVFVLQIVKGEEYLDDHKMQIQKTKKTQGTRGRILDRNGVVLADNILSYSVTIEDNGEYDNLTEKNQILNETIQKTIAIVETDNGNTIHNFSVIINENSQYEFSVSGTRKMRFLADIFGKKTIDELSEKEANYTAEELINVLCTDEKIGYGLDQEELSMEEVLKIINIRYAISLNSFQKYLETVIATGVSEKAVAAILENSNELQGVSIQNDSIRTYANSEYFSSITGYIGKISQEEYDNLDEKEKENYELTDIIGKSGIEQEMDATLQGEKGVVKMYVDNRGRIIDTLEGTEPAAGIDIHLTIDANLQIAAYKILEEKLAGIVLAKLTDQLSWDRSNVEKSEQVIIPIGDVYHSFFNNDLIDTSRFTKSDARETERAVLALYSAESARIEAAISAELSNPNAPALRNSPAQMQEYMMYIIQNILTEKARILIDTEINTTDKNYTNWREDNTISAYQYLNYAISMNWIDSSKLKDYMPEQANYSDHEEVYQGILNFILEELKTDKGFEKLLYKYMIREQKISAYQICLLLYEQGVLTYDEAQVQKLRAGSISPYGLIRSKIESLELTPGQLALEPCSGSFVMTDAKTGDVLACVSYPGYDSNRLSNSADATYFSMLFNHDASPMYNRATQERTAPGSTFKPLSSIMGLTEGVINAGTTIECRGAYDKVEPNPTCWSYPQAHGYLNVQESLEYSCNVYFYEVGYRLGLYEENGTTRYSSAHGLEKMNKYSEMFKMSTNTGVEIQESTSKISDEDSVRSAIGQGTHNYTTVQLARYANTLATKGVLYDLTLLEKTTDVNGDLIEQFESKEPEKLSEISESTWNTVQGGMRRVVSSNGMFSSVTSNGIKFSGKTGTTQQSKTHADHALFIGYAPSDDPEISFACRIANGYSSAYAAEVGREVLRYYYGLADESDIITGRAALINTNVHMD